MKTLIVFSMLLVSTAQASNYSAKAAALVKCEEHMPLSIERGENCSDHEDCDEQYANYINRCMSRKGFK